MKSSLELDHTADIAIELRAASLHELFEQAAISTICIVMQNSCTTDFSADSQRYVRLQATDSEELLVKWINEVLWLATSEGFLTLSAEITCDNRSATSLSARVNGLENRFDLIKTELKSATYHNLVIEQFADETLGAQIVLDV